MNTKPDPAIFRHVAADGDSIGTAFWFPHAGGGSASLVRQRLRIRSNVDLYAAILPGREERWGEGPVKDLSTMVSQLDQAIGPEPGSGVVLIGHSFGALLAYLIGGARCRAGNPPRAMIAMGLAAPDCCRPVTTRADASDEALIEFLDQHYGGIPPILKENPPALKQLLPAVRGDLRLLESYQYEPTAALRVDVIACGGLEDQVVEASSLERWRQFTQGNFQLRMFPGDHFFPYTNLPAILKLVEEQLNA